MKWLFVAGIWVAVLGCVNNPETEKETPDNEAPLGSTPAPTLFTELDSIVFNQWDYAYSRDKLGNTNSDGKDTPIYSEKGMSKLTQDTSLFLLDTAYDFFDDGYPILYVKTKFNPKGWNAIIDRKFDIRCSMQSETAIVDEDDWLIMQNFDETNGVICKERGQQFQVTFSLYTYHYFNLGFTFDPATHIGNYDGGKVRIYYWR